MITALYVIAILVILSGVVVGFFTGSLVGIVIGVLSSIAVSFIFFALAQILLNQEIIISHLQEVRGDVKKPPKTIVCKHCQQSYTADYSYCPHCATKQ